MHKLGVLEKVEPVQYVKKRALCFAASASYGSPFSANDVGQAHGPALLTLTSSRGLGAATHIAALTKPIQGHCFTIEWRNPCAPQALKRQEALRRAGQPGAK